MNKWIPINKKTPPEGAVLIVTMHDTLKQRRELRYPVYYRQSYYSNSYGFYGYGIESEKLIADFSKVIAWMPIPNPYEGEME